ncbi:hypothetical protein Kyoto98A_10000 [Helicobacter pylori]
MPKAKEYIDIASGFHKLFKNDAKIAESLKPATTKNLSQGLATSLSGALKYQWTKFTLGTLYRNAPDRILGVKLPKALNEATAGAALKYHIKRVLERSHSISDFNKQLNLSAKKSHFSNNTLKIIEELNNGVKQASEEIKEATKPSNLVKSIREQDTRPFEVIEDKEAFFKDLNQNLKDNATPLPKGMSVEEFKQTLESVENKDRFLEHLETRDNSQDRLKFISLIEPILRKPHIEIFIKDRDSAIAKKEYIKAFKDENNTRLYMLITQDNDTILRTFIPKLNERYMRNHVRDADIIHSFIQPNRTAKSDNALSAVVVYGENTTQKPLTSQAELLKTQETTLSKEQQEALKEFSAQFGGETKINANNANDFLREKIKSVFKNDENKLKAYDKVKEILTLDNYKEQQQAFIRAIRSDETGNTLAFLIEAANLSPKANANLKSILNQTTENLTKSLKQFDLKDYEIKSVFDNLEQGTKESYDKALNEIIGKLYDDSYKVNLRESVQDATNFQKFLNDLKAQGEIDANAKSFLRQIEENVYNPNGVTYEQLKNSRQLINAYLRNVKDPSTLGYIQKASANFLKNDIDNAIESLLKQNKSAYEKISELQKSAISDYRDMKQALELVDKAKIRDKNTHESAAVNSLMNIIKAQGQKDLSNYQALTKGLNESDKERLELSMLNRLMEQSLKQDESLKVFDSTHFFNKLNEFKDEVFSTPKAKEYIDIASGFHKLFKNDAKIAESLKPATTKNLSQGLATSLSGALKYQWTKFTLGTLYRNAPDRILGVKLPKALNEATAGAALKYHIKRALERSHSISDFNKQLNLSAKKSHFSNNTLKIIEELNNGVKQANEEIKEKATKYEKALKELQKIDESKLSKEQQQVLKVFKGELDQAEIKGIDLNDLYILEQGTRKAGAKKILIKHYGAENTGGLTNEELLNMGEAIKNGSVTLDSFKKLADGFRYAYEWDNNGVKLRLVVDDLDNGNKIFDFYSDRNFTDFKGVSRLPEITLNASKNTDGKIINQKPLTSQAELLKTQETTLKTQEATQKTQDLSPLEQAKAEKLAKLESEKLESEKEFSRLKEQEQARKEALKKKLEHERGNAGNIESATKIEVGEDIPTRTQAQIPKSRVRLNEREIYDLDYTIVKAKDLKPSFTTGGTQKRTDMNEEQIKSIAQNFDPKKIFGSRGFEDLPIILHDGQVIAGNHRIQGMLNFTPKSRFAYERAIKEYYHIDLKPDELLVRLPSKRLNNTEINNLAASSNQGRFNSESDHAIAVLSHYEPKLKELESQLDADSIYSLKNIVAKNLNFDKATHPNVGDSNLALLMFNMPRTKTQGIELLNRWQKVFSNDSKSYEKVKKMFVDNAGSFHNLIHDMSFPNVSLNAYLSDIMDRSFANLKNYPTTSESLKDLSEKFYKTSSLDMFEKSDQSTSDISEILGGAIARFARFDDPSKALFEALKSDNIKKGLKEFKIADVTKDMFNPNSKEFKDIDIYDFTHYLLMVGREPNENNPTMNRLIQAVKDMQKESKKGIKEINRNKSEFIFKTMFKEKGDYKNAPDYKKNIKEND